MIDDLIPTTNKCSELDLPNVGILFSILLAENEQIFSTFRSFDFPISNLPAYEVIISE